MTFRSKSPERVVRELGELTGRYGLNDFEVVDNILDTAYLRTLLVTLARDQPGYRFMYETKANLSADQIRLLADAGVRWIQPGIESVDDRVLKLIDKGTSAIINVNLLKWARAYGVRVSWNLLFGVPGERDEWYAEMATWFPLIAHLQPPSSGLAIRFDRFSPYHREPERFGLNLRHGRLYDYVYPVGPATLDDLAYFFRDERTEVIQFLQRTPLTGGGIRAMLHAMMSWRELWEDALHDASRPANPLPVLRRHDDSEGGTRIVDTRPCAPAPEVHLDGLPLQVLDATATPRAPGAVVQAVRGMGARISERQVLDALSSLVGRRLVVELSGRVLSLPTTGPDPALPDAMRGFPGGYVDVEAYRRDGAASRSLAASASASGVPITSAVNT
jgi:magnesium-protoporphyrin IX monomethyl ester (oxidative) cyclase